jgi:hypothetical protein
MLFLLAQLLNRAVSWKVQMNWSHSSLVPELKVGVIMMGDSHNALWKGAASEKRPESCIMESRSTGGAPLPTGWIRELTKSWEADMLVDMVITRASESSVMVN